MKDNNDGNDSLCGTRRTRFQAAPDWTVTESLILVNEVAAVEADCSRTLSSYQQWNIIADNCAALDVGRNLGQCRRKWDSLLSEYDKIRSWETKHARGSYWSLKSERAKKHGLPQNFEPELFKAIDDLVKAREERGVVELESDPEPGNEALDVTVEIVKYAVQFTIDLTCFSGQNQNASLVVAPSLYGVSSSGDAGVYLQKTLRHPSHKGLQKRGLILKDVTWVVEWGIYSRWSDYSRTQVRSVSDSLLAVVVSV